VATYRNVIGGGYNILTQGIASPQSIIDCGSVRATSPRVYAFPTDVCAGGYESIALQIVSGGVATCSPNGCTSGCVPYCAPTCGSVAATCTNNCVAGAGVAKGSIAYGASVYRITNTSKEAIKRELYFNGPTTTSLDVYQSWLDFCDRTPTAVFEAQNLNVSTYAGGHAATLVGWGTDAKGDYWILQNSWSNQWGDRGFFYVRAGLNLMKIESYLFANKFSATATAKKVKREDEVTEAQDLRIVGAAVALDPASTHTQSLGYFVSQQVATEYPSFEFASMQSATSQVVSGVKYELSVVGTDGSVASATLFKSSTPGSELTVVGTPLVVRNAATVDSAKKQNSGDSSQVKNKNSGNNNNDKVEVKQKGGQGQTVNNNSGDLSGGAIAGAVVGSVLGTALLLALLAGACFAYAKLRRNNGSGHHHNHHHDKRSPGEQPTIDEIEKGQPSSRQPDYAPAHAVGSVASSSNPPSASASASASALTIASASVQVVVDSDVDQQEQTRAIQAVSSFETAPAITRIESRQESTTLTVMEPEEKSADDMETATVSPRRGDIELIPEMQTAIKLTPSATTVDIEPMTTTSTTTATTAEEPTTTTTTATKIAISEEQPPSIHRVQSKSFPPPASSLGMPKDIRQQRRTSVTLQPAPMVNLTVRMLSPPKESRSSSIGTPPNFWGFVGSYVPSWASGPITRPDTTSTTLTTIEEGEETSSAQNY